MRKKAVFGSLLLALAVILPGVVWYQTPVHFLKDVEAGEVACIQAFDGDTGIAFAIEGAAEISYIISNIQNAAMVRDKLCSHYDGTLFHLWFYDGGGELLDEFTINWKDTIRGRRFFYVDPEGSLCVDDLKALEEASKG